MFSMAQLQQVAISAFVLGLATGITVLAMSAYLSVSPAWLRWLLLASGIGVAGRYVMMIPSVMSLDPCPLWLFRIGEAARWVGLTLPGVVALDQLVRHPAMTPKKLLRWYAPFLVAACVALLLGRSVMVSDSMAGPRPLLVGWARGLFGCAQGVLVVAYLSLSVLLMMKLRSWHIRLALAILMAAYASLGLDGGLALVGRRPVGLLPFSEILTLLALWFALETARHHTL